jgi:hypothetical protein
MVLKAFASEAVILPRRHEQYQYQNHNQKHQQQVSNAARFRAELELDRRLDQMQSGSLTDTHECSHSKDTVLTGASSGPGTGPTEIEIETATMTVAVTDPGESESVSDSHSLNQMYPMTDGDCSQHIIPFDSSIRLYDEHAARQTLVSILDEPLFHGKMLGHMTKTVLCLETVCLCVWCVCGVCVCVFLHNVTDPVTLSLSGTLSRTPTQRYSVPQPMKSI